jgi:hypothetical protein
MEFREFREFREIGKFGEFDSERQALRAATP